MSLRRHELELEYARKLLSERDGDTAVNVARYRAALERLIEARREWLRQLGRSETLPLVTLPSRYLAG